MNHRMARAIQIALGVWLFISAFAWSHTPSQFNNAWVVGALIAIMAAASMAAPLLRYANTALAVWLFISPFVLPTIAAATMWNHIIVAVALFLASMVPEVAARRRPTRRTA
jgi:fructose-specific phosphotransferase system IIC component